MNKNIQGIIAIAVLGGVGFFVYRWVKRGGLDRLISGQKVLVATEKDTPFYPYNRDTNKVITNSKNLAKRGQIIGNYGGWEKDLIWDNNTLKGLIATAPDNTLVWVEKSKVKIK